MVSDAHRSIVFLSPPVAGHQHDYTLFKESDFPDHLPQEVCCWVDLAFQGMATAYPHLNVIIPDKKSRGGELTDDPQARKLSQSQYAGSRGACHWWAQALELHGAYLSESIRTIGGSVYGGSPRIMELSSQTGRPKREPDQSL